MIPPTVQHENLHLLGSTCSTADEAQLQTLRHVRLSAALAFSNLLNCFCCDSPLVPLNPAVDHWTKLVRYAASASKLSSLHLRGETADSEEQREPKGVSGMPF